MLDQLQSAMHALAQWLSLHPQVEIWYTTVVRFVLLLLAVMILGRAVRSLLTIPHTPEIWGQLSLPNGSSIPLTHWENIIGRAKSADVCLNYPSVSRQHAALCRGEGETWTLYDLDSKGGTAVNGEKVEAAQEVKLGDTNTTLPVSPHQSEEDILSFATRNQNKITCINVSRHMQHYVVESNDSLLARLPVPFRVNCILYRNYPKEGLVPYLERFLKVPGASIQFRFDYTATTPENLYDQAGDTIFQDLKSVARYSGLDGCRMRCGFHFDYKGMELTYHKTLPYSTIVETDPSDGVTYDILYDILIKQTGALHSDWTGVPLDVAAYEKVVFEPDDLHWIEKV